MMEKELVLFEDDEVVLLRGVDDKELKKTVVKTILDSGSCCLSFNELRGEMARQGIFVSGERLRIILVELIEEGTVFYDFVRECYRVIERSTVILS